ncbi:MAG TPA: CAP domain-containing protein [Anaerolineae bacterium]|nr:CAP domain-containing protein [Anaerolineae bacterium]
MRIRLILLAGLLLSYILPLGLSPVAAQGDDAAQILSRINALRQQNGLLPLDLSSILTTSAQRHSDDMARTGNIDHNGSDGSTIESRIRDAGYGHWRGFGIWGENIYGGQLADVDAAWDFWINSQVHRANILKPRYREIGIGVGRSDKGTFYTLNFGSQPNVLPFFVTGSAPVVTLLLTNENDITTGEGVQIMGQATQVRIAEGTDTKNAGWQPWAQAIPFQLSDGTGQKTITVEYKDDLGRGTKFSRTFNVSDLGPAATSTVFPTATVEATATVRVTSTTTNTPAPTAAGTPQPTDTATPQPTETPTAVPTDTPPPTVTPTLAATTAVPTATPIPIASATPKVTATPLLIAANLATYPSASRLTPLAPLPASPDRPLFDFAESPGGNTFAIVIGLQAIVLVVIGVAVMVRIRRRP